MNKSKVIIVGHMGDCTESLRKLAESIKALDFDVLNTYQHRLDVSAFDQMSSRDCKNDHGERTNYKLKDQPFYHRNRTGKMRGY